jgi:hypothetical protein
MSNHNSNDACASTILLLEGCHVFAQTSLPPVRLTMATAYTYRHRVEPALWLTERFIAPGNVKDKISAAND